MTIEEYQTLTGTVVSSADTARVTAQINRTKFILEGLLGYTLTAADVLQNEYTELGKTADSCPCPDIDMDSLEDPDAVVAAYRLFPYNRDDVYIHIDPATAVHKVKLVKDGVTFKTLDPDEYRLDFKRGIVTYLERRMPRLWCICDDECYCVQLAVDADWLDEVPEDLQLVWADMVTYYADDKNNIRSQTLGPHSYTKFEKVAPETEDRNIAVIEKYAGPNGSLNKTLTI